MLFMSDRESRVNELRTWAMKLEDERRVGIDRTVDRLLASLVAAAVNDEAKGGPIRKRFVSAFGSKSSCYGPPAPEKEAPQSELAELFELDARVLARAYAAWLSGAGTPPRMGGAPPHSISGSAEWRHAGPQIQAMKRTLVESTLRYAEDLEIVLNELPTPSPPSAVRMMESLHSDHAARVKELSKAVLKAFGESGAGRPRERLDGVSARDMELYYRRVVTGLAAHSPECWRPYLQKEDAQTSDKDVIGQARQESVRALSRAKRLLGSLPKEWPQRATAQRMSPKSTSALRKSAERPEEVARSVRARVERPPLDPHGMRADFLKDGPPIEPADVEYLELLDAWCEQVSAQSAAPKDRLFGKESDAP
jgi:hypothetical protein